MQLPGATGAHPRCASPALLHSALSITPTLKLPNARSLRQLQRRTNVHVHASESSNLQNEPAQPTTKPPPGVLSGRSSALTALLRSTAIPDATVAKQLGLSEEYLQTLMELPGTTTVYELKSRLVALSQWQTSLGKGVLPAAGSVDWPAEPFRSKFLNVLKKLEMPRFTRRYPKLLNSLLKQFLELAGEFETKLLEEEGKQANQQQQQKQQSQPPPQSSGGGDDQDSQQSKEEGSQGGTQGNAQEDPSGQTEESDERGESTGEDGQKSDIQMELQNMEGGQTDPNADGTDLETSLENTGYADKLAEEMLKKFEDDWAPAMEALDTASQAFEDIEELMDGPEGFDNSKSVWHQSGWREVNYLRKRLEELRELRELVRSLGRGGGMGPLRKAPRQLYKTGNPAGIIRTEQSPEETRGLTRSGDLSRMLPMEAHLLAAGWPRKSRGEESILGIDASKKGNTNSSSSSGSSNKSKQGGTTVKEESIDGLDRLPEEGSRACRLLFMARRAERQLMSYERTGWSENEPTRVTDRLELRPAAEMGPIIVCLDTSGSMNGARETVAKALTLECMRGAHRQGRKCYVYAFSGPGDVMELELGSDAASMSKLLSFLTMSFSGGTDVDAPLALSLERLTREGWELVRQTANFIFHCFNFCGPTIEIKGPFILCYLFNIILYNR